jgi:hypothetical protein
VAVGHLGYTERAQALAAGTVKAVALRIEVELARWLIFRCGLGCIRIESADAANPKHLLNECV